MDCIDLDNSETEDGSKYLLDVVLIWLDAHCVLVCVLAFDVQDQGASAHVWGGGLCDD